jgi:hypothetical protein
MRGGNTNPPANDNTMTYTTTKSPETLIEMFIDGTPNEVYEHGRLATVPTEQGVQLVAYGHEILAETNGEEITIYTNQHGTVSRTVTDYVKLLGSTLNEFENRTVTANDQARPTMGIGTRVSESAKYISNYFDVLTSRSNVEDRALNEVNHYLSRRMEQIFG